MHMKWTQDCRLGISEIDSQHRLLFAIANELLDIENPLEQRLEFKYMIDHLRKYVDEHFHTEGKFMEDIKYPEYEEHVKMHNAIIEDINNTLKSCTDLRTLKERLQILMSNWIKDHICEEDKRYAKWYHQNRQPEPEDSV